MPRLLVEKGPDRGKAVTVTTGQQIVAGRDKSADLQLSDTMASRKHFLIASKGSIFGLKDLGSANGTLVNGRKAEGAHKLQAGDSIQVGETLLSWLADETQDKQGGLIGHAIGGYRIEERLGRGAMGTVYKATQLSLGRTVALKVLSPDLVKDEKFCEMFVKEARAAGGLNHPNIIQVYDVGDENGNYYFSMEFAARGSVLEELQAQRQIPLTRAVKIIRDACAALDYAERKGLVHRDIKPDNLMVMEDHTVKLGDLGLAMSTVELQAEQDGVFGTPHYIAPEQAMGKPIDHRADIYALGATFYRMLSGKTLFTGTTVKEILKKQVREVHPPITDWVPDCPEAIGRILDRMLIKNPAERYQHASEIAQDLTDFENLSARKTATSGSAFGARVTGLSPDQSQRIHEQKSKRSLMIAAIAAIAAVLAAVVSVSVFAFGGSDPGPENNAPIIGGANNESNTPPVNGTGVAPDVAAANKRVEERITIAKHLLDNPPSTPEDLDRDLDRIDSVLRETKAKADPELHKQLTALRDRLWAKRNEMLESFQAAKDEHDEAWRKSQALINDFKFEGAKEPLAAFITKWKDSKDPQILALVTNTEKDLKESYPDRCLNVQREFARRIAREEQQADGMSDAALKVATIEGLAQRVRETEEACDEANAKKSLGELAARLERKVATLKKDADRAEQLRIEGAAARARQTLDRALKDAATHVSNGNFAAANRVMEDWKVSDPDFTTDGSHELFKAHHADLKARSEQTTLILESLQVLVGSLPSVSIQKTNLLKNQPWPKDASDLFGGGDNPISIEVERNLQDRQWKLNVVAGAGPRTMPAGDFNTRARRVALGNAIAHLFLYHDGMKQALTRATASGPCAAVGVYAWLMDMEAYEAATPFIEWGFEKTPPGNRHYNTVREYYAWSLLARAELASAQGDRNKANEYLQRLATEFTNTRANKGRK